LEISILSANQATGNDVPGCSMWNMCRSAAFELLYGAPSMAQHYIDLGKSADAKKDEDGSRDANGFLRHGCGATEDGCKTAPDLIDAPPTVCPPVAAKLKIQGVVVVSLMVDEQGHPTRLQVGRRVGYDLDQAALDAVAKYKFKPATVQGKPAPVEVNIEVNFRINKYLGDHLKTGHL
jgi:TonB family protein